MFYKSKILRIGAGMTTAFLLLAGCENTGSGGYTGGYYDTMIWNDYYRPRPPRPDRPERPPKPEHPIERPKPVQPIAPRPPVTRPPPAPRPTPAPRPSPGRFR